MKKGSITVFFALVLSIIIVLICTCIESVKMMCARTQIANSADVGMYSLFAQYDPYLLKRYNLFYIDASYGADALRLSKAYRTVEEYMEPILNQNYLELSIVSGGVTGFVLATDCNGQPFRDQAVAYMKDMPGSQGIHFLVNAMLENVQEIKKAQEMRQWMQVENIMAKYEEEIAWAGNESAQAELYLQNMEIASTPNVTVENPLDFIREAYKRDILELVISDLAELSNREMDIERLASHRKLQQGMGALCPTASDSETMDKALFQEYIMQKCGTYTNPSDGSGLKYQVEYMLGKCANDRDNLKKVAKRLMAIREGINLEFLYTDLEKREQSVELARAIADSFLVRPEESVIEEALLLGWAFGESVWDVKTLFDGGRVSLLKTSQNWNLSLEDVPRFLQEVSLEQSVGADQGMNYADYLRALLFLEPEDSKVMGGVDIIEADIQSQQGRENFRMDCCLESMEVEVDVRVNQLKTYTVQHRYGYNFKKRTSKYVFCQKR